MLSDFCFTEKFFSGNSYLKMLKGIIDPLIKEIYENSVNSLYEQVISEQKPIFQNDNCPTQ